MHVLLGVIQRIHSLAHCSEINAMKKTHQIFIMISGVRETSLINKEACSFIVSFKNKLMHHEEISFCASQN
jgi:hypothetical protein